MAWLAKVGDDYKPGALESTLHWQVIWPRAIALAWEDPRFHAALKADPKKAIKDTFGYKLSDNLDLEIVDAPADDKYDEAAAADPWHNLPQLKLTLSIPPKPPAEIQAVAITTYQDTSRTYPFTCC